MAGSQHQSGPRILTAQALYATPDARKYAAYVATDTPAPRAAPGVAAGWAGTKQGTPWGALLWFWGDALL